MAEFLHGVETQRQKSQNSVTEVDTSIVCVVGTAPIFQLESANRTINKPQPIRGYDDIALYAGDDIEGFTLPDALKTILDESGGANMYMINVFNPETHIKTVEKQVTLSNKKAVLDDFVLELTSVKNGETTYAEGTDFELVDNTIVGKSQTFNALSNVTVKYTAPDVTEVTTADIVGTVDANGKRTGIKAIEDVSAIYGDEVGIVGVPEYSAIKEVRTELETLSDELKFFNYFDSAKDMNKNQAIAVRTTAANGKDSTTTTENGLILTPWVKRYSTYRDSTDVRPPSPVAIGLRVKLDRERNVAKSIDNTVSKTVLGTEYPISFKLNKANTDANALNAVGYSTFINRKGSFYLWGGRNCSFPSKSGIETFEHTIRTANMIEESVQNSSFEFVGESVNQGFINNVLEMVKNYFKKLKNPQNQVILDGDVWYDPNSNLAADVANGHVVFDYEFCPPSTVERMTYRSKININIITNALNT